MQGFVDLGRIRPFVKWAGGKAQLLRELDKMIPQFNRYFEPFLSGGAMFFYLIQNRRFIAYLSDTNKELITTYKVVKDYVGNLRVSRQTSRRIQEKSFSILLSIKGGSTQQ